MTTDELLEWIQQMHVNQYGGGYYTTHIQGNDPHYCHVYNTGTNMVYVYQIINDQLVLIDMPNRAKREAGCWICTQIRKAHFGLLPSER